MTDNDYPLNRKFKLEAFSEVSKQAFVPVVVSKEISPCRSFSSLLEYGWNVCDSTPYTQYGSLNWLN